MRGEKLYNILESFDFRLLENPEFQEDSVREEIVVPLVKGLGYSANPPNQIIRSRKLTHPFVSIGSKRKNISIIPDYLFEVNHKPVWILDAKSPSEPVVKSKNVEQAYSYAMHSEVRVSFFALCNGREFALYSVSENEPLLHFDMTALPVYWESLKNILAPNKIISKNPMEYAKDLGLHLKRLGFDEFESLIFPRVPITSIGQLDNHMFSISAGSVELGYNRYVVTFDFDLRVLKQLIGKIPDEAIEKLLNRHKEGRTLVKFADTAYFVDIDCAVGEKLEENDKEIFLPLKINKIIS